MQPPWYMHVMTINGDESLIVLTAEGKLVIVNLAKVTKTEIDVT